MADACSVTHLYIKGLGGAQHIGQQYACTSFSEVTLGFITSNCQFDLLAPLHGIFSKKFPLISGAKEALGTSSRNCWGSGTS